MVIYLPLSVVLILHLILLYRRRCMWTVKEELNKSVPSPPLGQWLWWMENRLKIYSFIHFVVESSFCSSSSPPLCVWHFVSGLSACLGWMDVFFGPIQSFVANKTIPIPFRSHYTRDSLGHIRGNKTIISCCYCCWWWWWTNIKAPPTSMTLVCWGGCPIE